MSQIVVPKGWELKKFKDFSNVIRGSSPRPKGDPRYFGGNIPWIKISDITASKGKYVFSTKEGLTEDGVSHSRFLKSGSLILTTSMLIAMPKILKMNGCIHDGFLAILDIDNEINSEFLYYYFLAYRGKIELKSSLGSAIKNINTEVVKNLEIPIPPLETQKKIVAKLDHIFSQLEEKKKEILSRIEKFDAKKINQSYRNHLMKLAFDGTLTDENPGEIINGIQIPKGWELKKLVDVILDFEKRNPESTPEKEFKYVEIGGINENKIISDYRTILGKNSPSRARNVIRKNDVIYGTTRPYYRNVVLIPEEFDNEICSTGFCVLRSNSNEILPKYLFYYMLSDTANNQIIKPMRGGSYPAVSNKDVTATNLPCPPLETQKKIVQILDKKFAEWDTHKQELENIQKIHELIKKHINELTSSILNEAFSGKLVN